MQIVPRNRRGSNPAECFFCQGSGDKFEYQPDGDLYAHPCFFCAGTGDSQLGLILNGRLEPPADFECGTTVLKVGGHF